MLKITQATRNNIRNSKKLTAIQLLFQAKLELIDKGVNPSNAKLIIIDNDGKARKVVKIRKAATNA